MRASPTPPGSAKHPTRLPTAAILYADFGDEAGADDQDVLVQAREFARVLAARGYRPEHVRLSLNLLEAASRLRALAPEIVVNLVESVAGSDALQYLGPALLEHLGLAYTGCRTEAVFLAANKLLAKRTLAAGGLPTPAWHALPEIRAGADPGEPPWIIKPVGEHASRGIEEDAVVRELSVLRARAAREDAGRLYVERFVEGRELNVSLLDGPRGVEVLPPAEIDFSGFPAGKARIVGYRAKWDETSEEYRHSLRTFRFSEADHGLLARVGEIARRVWDLLGLRGYARVDFRIDEAGGPWVLEANTNPCLSPEAGFAAAAAAAGIPLDGLLCRIVEAGRSTP